MRLPWSASLSAAEKTVAAIAVVSLLATVTNLVPFSAALALPALVAPLLLVGRRAVLGITLSLVVLLGYFVVWTLLYHPFSLLEYGFFRRDGNVFITFAPLLLLSLLRLPLEVGGIVRRFLYVASGLNGMFLAIYALTGGTIFFYEEGIYHFLFHAHNAAGGFLAVLTALALGYYCATRERVFLLLTVVNAAGLIATDSRGSVLGLLAACGIVLLLRGNFTRSMVAAMIIAHLVVVPWLYQLAPPGALLVEHPAMIDAGAFDALPRSHTIALRAFYLWPRAWHLFLASPVVGTGFGSYNDLPYTLEGAPPIFQVNRPMEAIYSDSHAHHTFLHVLAETGLVGLALLVVFLVQARRFILRIPDPSLRYGLHLVFWIAVISSLTEHRLFTPSQMLPFTIILGLAIARHEHARWQAQREARLQAVPRSGGAGSPVVAGAGDRV